MGLGNQVQIDRKTLRWPPSPPLQAVTAPIDLFPPALPNRPPAHLSMILVFQVVVVVEDQGAQIAVHPQIHIGIISTGFGQCRHRAVAEWMADG